MADEVAPQADQKAKKKGRGLTILIVAMLMIGEGVAIFFLVKALNPAPDPAMAEGDGERESEELLDTDDLAEVELAECRPSNKMTGKFVTFHIRVSGLVSAEDADMVKKMVRARRARLEHAVNVIIRSAEPKHLNEPGLETLQRRLEHEIDRILGDESLIKQVLIPQMLQSGSGV